jgi:HPt (histidine-containing phosphotransfer) domain-containing protein
MLIDRSILTAMCQAIGRQVLIQVEAELAHSLRTFATEFTGLDAAALATRAHTLKGSTGYLGTADLHMQAILADRIARQGGDPRPALAELIRLIEPSLVALSEAIAELPD